MKRTTLCAKPFNGFGCGQCLPCRLRKRREWTHRIMLEAMLHERNCFLTLTYADSPITLVPADHRRFLDALRKRVGYRTFRYYMVGEYGDASQRPHFHYALFGLPSCMGSRNFPRSRCCPACDLLEEVWGRGLIKNLPLEIGSARYIARYVVKKMTRTDDPRLGNRHPEFSRQSLKPGIGFGVVESIADTITRYNLLTPEGDVPVTLRHGSQEWPLGRYLRRKLRRHLGLDERAPHALTPEGSYRQFHEDQAMRAVQAAALADPQNPSLKHHLLAASQARRDQLARRQNLKDGNREL